MPSKKKCLNNLFGPSLMKCFAPTQSTSHQRSHPLPPRTKRSLYTPHCWGSGSGPGGCVRLLAAEPPKALLTRIQAGYRV